jgi:hypothetical protein
MTGRKSTRPNCSQPPGHTSLLRTHRFPFGRSRGGHGDPACPRTQSTGRRGRPSNRSGRRSPRHVADIAGDTRVHARKHAEVTHSACRRPHESAMAARLTSAASHHLPLDVDGQRDAFGSSGQRSELHYLTAGLQSRARRPPPVAIMPSPATCPRALTLLPAPSRSRARHRDHAFPPLVSR